MGEKKYTMTLSDGTVLSDLTLNITKYVSATPIDENVFDGALSPVIISDGKTETIHENTQLTYFATLDNGGCEFVLTDLTSMELAIMQIQANQVYIAMMAGIDI
jgi:hypothetical protein